MYSTTSSKPRALSEYPQAREPKDRPLHYTALFSPQNTGRPSGTPAKLRRQAMGASVWPIGM